MSYVPGMPGQLVDLPGRGSWGYSLAKEISQRPLAAEILLDLFRALLGFIRRVSGAGAGVEHLG
jgi:hypothetical protein